MCLSIFEKSPRLDIQFFLTVKIILFYNIPLQLYSICVILHLRYIRITLICQISERGCNDKNRYLFNEVSDMSGKIPGMDVSVLVALAEPNRMAIVELLRDGPLTVGEIANRLELSQPHASKHLKVLSNNGIVEVKPEANRRYYKLRSEPFQVLEYWVTSFQKNMERKFDNLDDYVQELQNKKQ